jgi:hypothetical protein
MAELKTKQYTDRMGNIVSGLRKFAKRERYLFKW